MNFKAAQTYEITENEIKNIKTRSKQNIVKQKTLSVKEKIMSADKTELEDLFNRLISSQFDCEKSYFTQSQLNHTILAPQIQESEKKELTSPPNYISLLEETLIVSSETAKDGDDGNNTEIDVFCSNVQKKKRFAWL